MLACFHACTFSNHGEAAQVAVDNRCTSLRVSGETKLTGAGGVILSSLSIPANAKLVLDPIATPVYVSSAPTFGAGAKIALPSDYKRMTLGRIVLMTYSGSATFVQSLFDAKSVAPGATCKLSQETAPDGTNKQLVLTVGDYEHNAKDITVAPMGDSLTQGVKDSARGDYPQYRTAVAARLAAAGYRPKFVGIWQKSNLDAAGVRQPDDWTSHSGIAGAAIVATARSVGFTDNMPRYLDSAGYPDVITLCIGENDFILNKKDAAETFTNFVALVNATAAKRPNAKIIGTTLPPVPNNQNATRKVLEFNKFLTTEYAKAGHGELPDNFHLLDFVAILQNLVQSGKVPRDLKGYCARDAHPNWKGHDLISRAFAEKISEVCPFASPRAATFISGVNPELHTYNREGECGTGAVVPWAGSLWAISYAPHEPKGSTDKLYEIKPDFTKIIHKESIGGTPANRLIHRESNQLFIGPYAIDAKGNVRVMKPMNDDSSTNLYGRLTASARHLFDPAHKIYTMTMEEGVYEIDVDTLKVTELFRDGNIQGVGKSKLGGDLLPGYHGKGGYSGQGRLIYANNGEFSPAAKKDPTTPSGVLAEWNGKPGKENWKVVLRNQFTDVTSKGGIYGAEHPESDPLWAVGWDVKSVILMVLDGGEWHKYRLPKGSHSYDGAHGWNTEWPRIREIGEGDDFLMTMHGTFWHFPATMSAKNSAGIRPRSNYLKVVGDFCRWGDKVVLGCDDTAQSGFLNKRKAKGGIAGPGQSNSNLWFLGPGELDSFGPAIGRGAVWQGEDVKAGAVSDPYLLAGFDKRTLYVSSKTAFSFDIEVDDKGDGKWRRVDWHGASSAAGHQVVIVPLELEKGEWVRLVAKNDAKDVTAFFNYANEDKRTAEPDPIFAGIGGMTTQMGDCEAVVRCGGGDEKLKLQLLDVTGNSAGGYYEMDADLKLKKVADCGSRQAADMRKKCRVLPNRVIMDGEGVVAEKSSILVVDDNGARWRLPWSGGWRSEGGKGQIGRTCREVCTERDLLNVGGTFYELPAENAGGYAKMRPIATHDNMFIYDYCTWRGLLVITGLMRFGRPENPRIVTESTAGVWLGTVDELWEFGKPRGEGGPWLKQAVRAGEASDPYIMTGFDKKRMTVSADKDAKIKVEIDLTGSGTWSTLMSIDVKAGTPVEKDLSGIRAYWVRAVADRDCKATVQFRYE